MSYDVRDFQRVLHATPDGPTLVIDGERFASGDLAIVQWPSIGRVLFQVPDVIIKNCHAECGPRYSLPAVWVVGATHAWDPLRDA